LRRRFPPQPEERLQLAGDPATNLKLAKQGAAAPGGPVRATGTASASVPCRSRSTTAPADGFFSPGAGVPVGDQAPGPPLRHPKNGLGPIQQLGRLCFARGQGSCCERKATLCRNEPLTKILSRCPHRPLAGNLEAGGLLVCSQTWYAFAHRGFLPWTQGHSAARSKPHGWKG